MHSKLGLGLAALGRPGYINLGHAEDLKSTNYAINAMRNHAASVLDTAWELGIRYFDVARSYGRAEEFLAYWIDSKEAPQGEITVGSKWGYTYTAAWKVQTAEGVKHEIKRHELKVLKSQFQQTMKHLSSHLDLYQIHSATLESGVLENEEILDCLYGLKNSGIKVGLSVSGPQQAATIDKALTIKMGNELLFDSVQATWNLLERSASQSLATAHSQGLEVIVKESLANGKLTDRNDSPQFEKGKRELERIANEHKVTIDAIAIAAALNQNWASTVLCGAANSDHLRSNAKATTVNWTDDLLEPLDSLAQSPEDYWNQRSEMEWN